MDITDAKHAVLINPNDYVNWEHDFEISRTDRGDMQVDVNMENGQHEGLSSSKDAADLSHTSMPSCDTTSQADAHGSDTSSQPSRYSFPESAQYQPTDVRMGYESWEVHNPAHDVPIREDEGPSESMPLHNVVGVLEAIESPEGHSPPSTDDVQMSEQRDVQPPTNSSQPSNVDARARARSRSCSIEIPLSLLLKGVSPESSNPIQSKSEFPLAATVPAGAHKHRKILPALHHIKREELTPPIPATATRKKALGGPPRSRKKARARGGKGARSHHARDDVHDDEPPRKCGWAEDSEPACEQQCHGWREFSKHVIVDHAGDFKKGDSVECCLPDCGKEIKKENLSRHIQSHYGLFGPCPCDKFFSRAWAWKRHEGTSGCNRSCKEEVDGEAPGLKEAVSPSRPIRVIGSMVLAKTEARRAVLVRKTRAAAAKNEVSSRLRPRITTRKKIVRQRSSLPVTGRSKKVVAYYQHIKLVGKIRRSVSTVLEGSQCMEKADSEEHEKQPGPEHKGESPVAIMEGKVEENSEAPCLP
ncbi:uncharacterized protein LAESUDRAFT_812654 [Laetiporus sulphureus 93-53]|uniref:Uncharacterized protein n=1 Tax=Laetiporus sulphureus 93-53 TaxID=1314785 RepID=A0A165EBZ0_9APHY|nr:uncharacterized protein LAESUDRAFT_812654 [Laetiporus sulphureus 93-53]KZT06692.1 hypothetical protein LAESUDRAFT_812654 [Laetiporus sulphureus 93-53]